MQREWLREERGNQRIVKGEVARELFFIERETKSRSRDQCKNIIGATAERSRDIFIGD